MYILQCSDGTFYTGSTINIEIRLFQHQLGEGATYTKTRLPVTLIYIEEYSNIADAFNREKQVQGWSRKKKVALIQGNSLNLHHYSECTNHSSFQFRTNKSEHFDSAQ